MKTQNLFYGLLAVLMLFVTACSNDDADTLDTLAQKAVGTWKPVKDVTVCSTGSKEEENYSVCEQSGRLIINSNGTFSESYYDDYSGTCSLINTLEGTWKIVDNKFIINAFGGGVEDDLEITFFEVTSNVIRLGQYDEYFLCDGNMPSSHYYTEYIRI